MEKSHSPKPTNRILAAAIVVALLAVAAYFAYFNVPRRLSQLYPEVKRAELCNVLFIDENMGSTSMSFEGRELEELIGHLDSFLFYPYPQGQKSDGAVVLEGDSEWHFYFQINGKPTDKALTITNHEQASIGERVYEIRDGRLDLLP